MGVFFFFRVRVVCVLICVLVFFQSLLWCINGAGGEKGESQGGCDPCGMCVCSLRCKRREVYCEGFLKMEENFSVEEDGQKGLVLCGV